jgi:rhodanese-related sulfurtransferase
MVDATDCGYIMHELAPAKCVTQRVKEGDVLTLAGQTAKVLETPGHTRDSISLLFADKLLTGDFLFLDDAGAGRDDLPGGDAEAHWKSLQKLKSVPGSVVIYPAHEYRDRQPSTLQNQRETNPHLKDMGRGEFTSYINDLKLGPADWMKDVLKANYRCATDPNSAWIPTDVPACEIKGTMNPNAGNIDVQYIAHLDINPGAVLIDVREKEELTGPLGHLDGVINIPVGEVAHSLSELEEYKGDEIILVCRSGARATTAAQILITAGYEKVKVLDGGMLAVKSAR